jgi:hypothetical protein
MLRQLNVMLSLLKMTLFVQNVKVFLRSVTP